MRNWIFTFLLLFFVVQSFAQNPVAATSSELRMQSAQKAAQLRAESLVKNLAFENIGPSVMSGRVVDVDVDPTNPAHFYAAFASSGLWVTENNGQSFEPLFQQQVVMSIGDIAVDWQHGERIWVGTGENNSSRSSYSGTGMYLSTDKGKTWQYKGLAETEHIGRVVLDPKDRNTVYVAAIGHLYSPNLERGVFVTHDGGASWKKSLFVNDNAGAIDLVIDAENPNVLYASIWNRQRRAWNFEEAGDGSGIYKTMDGGKAWVKLNKGSNGFPDNTKIGRIGLALYSKNGKKVLYAVVDNQNFRPQIGEKESKEIKKEDFAKMSAKEFDKLDDKQLESFLRKNDFPEKYTSATVKDLVKAGKVQPVDLKLYLEDANALLFDTPIIGTEVYRSDDEGNTWVRTHADYLDDIFYTYGYYFGQIRVSPTDSDKIYIMGVPVLKSDDGGRNFTSISTDNVHADNHALWIDPQNTNHLILGNDGGLVMTYDDGKNWLNANSMPAGQFYSVAADMDKPYNVYGGLQDNGVWTGPSNYKASSEWMMSGQYPYKMIAGGDGMQVAVDYRDNNTVYTGSQFGYYSRINKTTGEELSIKPMHDLGESPYRFNWQTPIWLSIHNQDVIYLGSNHFHRSLNKGENMETLSGDLTKGGIKGDVSYGTITTIHESPLRFGLLYVGTDDGLVQLSKDGGYSWTNISAGLPENMWVTRVWASTFKESRVYVALNGYRWDNFTPYVFVSEDFGKSWTNITANLPLEAVNVVKEDPKNENILYVGTDHGLYISLNRGQDYQSVGESLPRVAVHDVAFQTRENDLLVATHGRSLYKANIANLEKLTADVMAQKLFVFNVSDVHYSSYWAQSWSKWFPLYEPKKELSFYSQSDGSANVAIYSAGGLLLYSKDIQASKGLNYYAYDLTFDAAMKDKFEQELNKEAKSSVNLKKADNDKFYLQPATYMLVIEVVGNKVEKEFKVVK